MRHAATLLAVLVAAALQAGTAAGAEGVDAILATGPVAATSTSADGRRRVELPWLEPGDGDLAVAPGGRLVAFSSARHGNVELYVADTHTGAVRRLTVNRRASDRHPSWSPDGRRLAWQSGAPGAYDLYAMDADGGRKRALVRGPGDDVEPAWSPDGARVAFSSNRDGRRNLWAVDAAGGEPVLLAAVPGAARAPAWSPDGRRIAFSRASAGDADVWVVDADGLEPRALTSGPGWDAAPDWSPDGRRLAFTRARGGAIAVWVARADGSRAQRVAGSVGDREPDWARVPPALAPAAGERLPDLVQRVPSGLVVSGWAGRYRLGFASATENLGDGPLVINGVRDGGRMRAHQVVEGRGGAVRLIRDVGALHYERHEPHFHWHLQDFVRYELRALATGDVVVRDRKTGFCLIDRYGLASRRVPGTGPPRFVSDCAAGQPDARRVVQGSSVGYVDRYPAHFHGQDLDLTGLAAGLYVLVQRANPERTMRELRYSNNDASLLVRLTWPGGPAAAPVVRVLRRCPGTARCAVG